jgi:hypothetical protein
VKLHSPNKIKLITLKIVYLKNALKVEFNNTYKKAKNYDENSQVK